MSLLSELTGQLGKLKLIFYSDPDKPGIGIPYSPPYNPTNFDITYTSTFDDGETIINGKIVKKFTMMNPRTLDLELFFDGTGASPSTTNLAAKAAGALGLGSINTVDVQIETLLALSMALDEEKHAVKYVMVIWGSFIMTGVVTQTDVAYKMFAPSGRPLRATVTLTIEENIASSLLSKIRKLFSPDLSKSIVVKEGDTLPLLCFQEYNDASLYPKVAEVNNLKNYRKLKQGMELLFPPIDNLA
jgi:contractile injection system tube protein